MWQRWLLALVMVVVTATAAGAKPSVQAPRTGVHEDFTRLVLDISEPLPYRIFTLPDPPRLVVDLPEVEFQLEASRPLSTPLVKTMRSGLFAPGLSRLVFDLNQPVEVLRAAVLPPHAGEHHRLYFDIAAIDSGTFAAAKSRTPVTSAAPLPDAVHRGSGPAEPVRDMRPLIVVDAGHGGVDPGAISVTGAYEKDITLAFAKTLAEVLKRSGRYRVMLTRDRDIFLPLNERFAKAERAQADLFISLHANIHSRSDIRGASVFTLSESGADSDADAAALAAKENGADAVAGAASVDQVAHILGDLMRRETMNLSKSYANRLVTSLGEVTVLLRNTHRFAGFRVLKSPTVPSVLLEIGYLSNASEEKLLHSKKHRAKIATAILEALDGYFVWQQALNRN